MLAQKINPSFLSTWGEERGEGDTIRGYTTLTPTLSRQRERGIEEKAYFHLSSVSNPP